MSFRAGHYFSLKNIDNYTEIQNNYEAIDFNDFSIKDLVQLWQDTLQKGIHGICFSIYEDGQKPGSIITVEQVERRIKILKPYSKWVRSFSCIEGNEHIPKIPASPMAPRFLVG